MLGTYLRELIGQALKSSWVAANGLAGGLLGGGAMIWRGVISIISGENPVAQAVNWTLSFAAYAAISWAILFVCNLVFVSPFQVWKSQRVLLSAVVPNAGDGRALPIARPRTPPNYQAWRHVEKFNLREAAYLWLDLEPHAHRGSPEAAAWIEAFSGAIRTGRLGFLPRPLKVGQYAVHDITDRQREWDRERQQQNPDSATEVSREQLVKFAKDNNEKPKFLES